MPTTPSNDRSLAVVGNGDGGSVTNEDRSQQFWKDDFVPLQVAGKSILQSLRQDEAAPDADLYRRITNSTASATNSANLENNPAHRYFVEDNNSTASTRITTPTTPTANGGGLARIGHQSVGDTSPLNGNYGAKSSTSLNLNHERSVPLPPYIAQQLKTIKVSTYMGLFPEAELSWLTVDDTLYLWNYKGATSKFGNFDDNSMLNSTGSMDDFLSFTVPTHRPIVSVGLVPPKPGMFFHIFTYKKFAACVRSPMTFTHIS